MDLVGVSDGSPENIGAVAPFLSCVSKKRKKKDDTVVEDSILEAVSRMEAAMEKDRTYARAISIRERMDTLQDLQRKYHRKEMEARIKGYKEEEKELTKEREQIEFEYKKNEAEYSKLNEG